MTIKVVVDDPDNPFVEPDTSVTDTTVRDSTNDTTTVIGLRSLAGDLDAFGFRAGEPLQVFDMQGRLIGTHLSKIRYAGVYLIRSGKAVRKIRVE